MHGALYVHPDILKINKITSYIWNFHMTKLMELGVWIVIPIKQVSSFHSSIRTFFFYINIKCATLEMQKQSYVGLPVKYPLLLTDFNQNLIALTNFSKLPLPTILRHTHTIHSVYLSIYLSMDVPNFSPHKIHCVCWKSPQKSSFILTLDD